MILSRPLAYMKLAFADRIAYRAHFIVGSVLRFVSLVVVVYLWRAVFSASGTETIGGFAYGDMVAYYYLVMVSRSFASMPGLATSVAGEIREGILTRFLVKPMGLLPIQVSLRMAHKVIFIAAALIPYLVVAWLLRWAFPGWPDGYRLAAYVFSLLMAFWIDFCVHFILGIMAFWFLEVTSFLFIAMMIEYFCSGHMIPLDLLPEGVRTVIHYLPFKYTAYYPAALFLGKVPEADIAGGMLAQGAWALGLFLIAWVMLKRGERRYAAYGG